ncbi:DUF4262 domain-containing protein [Variovorax sp. J2P1-59]|uniref:DUF4262 domain-containing protein n=1 Tax=Variovorax flavidus TaxID=3053501 RepID=UPI002575D8D4|nr:DUF4262 domain-containing protein [Variovorax sp. J2P1-59]MDM0073632.1 DUF4262 domain-containing protein [Variovorax sp. J2P1-59]
MFIQPEVVATLRRRIAREGWAMAGVGTRNAAVTYVYTVGLQKTFRHPDLIMFGIAPARAKGVLEIIAERAKAGEPVHESVMILGAAQVPLMPRSADTTRVELLVPAQLARGRYDYVQIVWPDGKERFPWEAGFDKRRLRSQSFLFDVGATDSLSP